MNSPERERVVFWLMVEPIIKEPTDSEEFHEKMSAAADAGLSYDGFRERENAKFIKEEEELMTQRAIESTTTKSKLQILREKLSGFFFKQK